MNCAEILKKMELAANPAAVAGMARYGITAKKAYGLSTPALKKLAREIGKDHALAQQLWATEILEARGLASLVDELERVSERQMERWVKDFDSWAVCDGTCLNLFRKTPFAHRKCREWSSRPEEFVKRAGFALLACLAAWSAPAGQNAGYCSCSRTSCEATHFHTAPNLTNVSVQRNVSELRPLFVRNVTVERPVTTAAAE